MSTSNSLDGKRRVTSSYCLNSGVSERNSWLSESSTFRRATPNAAAIASSATTQRRQQRKTQRNKADPLDPERDVDRLRCTPVAGHGIPLRRFGFSDRGGHRLRLSQHPGAWAT